MYILIQSELINAHLDWPAGHEKTKCAVQRLRVARFAFGSSCSHGHLQHDGPAWTHVATCCKPFRNCLHGMCGFSSICSSYYRSRTISPGGHTSDVVEFKYVLAVCHELSWIIINRHDVSWFLTSRHDFLKSLTVITYCLESPWSISNCDESSWVLKNFHEF